MVKQQDRGRTKLDIEHFGIHAGEHYHAAIADESMSNGNVLVLAFKTPNTSKYIHLLTIFGSKVGGHVEILEGGSWTRAQQSTVNIIQDERNSSNTSGLLEKAAQTDFTATSKLQGSFVALQSLQNTTTIYEDWLFSHGHIDGNRDVNEIVLKKDEEYVVRYTSDGNSNAGFIRLEWYEYVIDD